MEKNYTIKHIEFTLYEKNHIDLKLIQRLYRFNKKKEFRKKTFYKNDIQRIFQEENFSKYYHKYLVSKTPDEAIRRISTISFLRTFLDHCRRLKKITFFVSKSNDTQRVFHDDVQLPFKIHYSVKKLEINLMDAFGGTEKLLFRKDINKKIIDFKKFIRNGYYDEKIFKLMKNYDYFTISAIKLFTILTSSNFKHWEPIPSFIIDNLNNDMTVNSNPTVYLK